MIFFRQKLLCGLWALIRAIFEIDFFIWEEEESKTLFFKEKGRHISLLTNTFFLSSPFSPILGSYDMEERGLKRGGGIGRPPWICLTVITLKTKKRGKGRRRGKSWGRVGNEEEKNFGGRLDINI